MLGCLCLGLLLGTAGAASALPLKPGWMATGRLATPHATQAAAADKEFVYAISNTTVAQYDRLTGRLIATGTAADAKHLNSGFIWNGRVYCAHSNYPQLPEESDIRVYDPATRQLRVFHTFDQPPGSLVWCIHDGDHWWCCFAHYGEANAKTILVRFQPDWTEAARWTFPKVVIDDWDRMSASGGIFDRDAKHGQTLLVSHHHYRVLYRLRIPKQPGELEFIEALNCPFPGQGIAADPLTGGLVGIDRPGRAIVYAQRATKSGN